jgi:vacuolar-type H+-ATPase subunit H
MTSDILFSSMQTSQPYTARERIQSTMQNPLPIGRLEQIGRQLESAQTYNLTFDAWTYSQSRSIDRESTSERLQPDQLNKEYGIDGYLKFKTEMSRDSADFLKSIAEERMRNDSKIAQGPSDILSGVTSVGTAILSQFLDPIEFGIGAIPIVGWGKVGTKLNTAWNMSPFMRAVGKGAVAGAVGNAAAVPLRYSLKQQIGQEYGIEEAMMDVAAGAAFGAILSGSMYGLKKAFSKADLDMAKASIENLSVTERLDVLKTVLNRNEAGLPVKADTLVNIAPVNAAKHVLREAAEKTGASTKTTPKTIGDLPNSENIIQNSTLTPEVRIADALNDPNISDDVKALIRQAVDEDVSAQLRKVTPEPPDATASQLSDEPAPVFSEDDFNNARDITPVLDEDAPILSQMSPEDEIDNALAKAFLDVENGVKSLDDVANDPVIGQHLKNRVMDRQRQLIEDALNDDSRTVKNARDQAKMDADDLMKSADQNIADVDKTISDLESSIKELEADTKLTNQELTDVVKQADEIIANTEKVRKPTLKEAAACILSASLLP